MKPSLCIGGPMDGKMIKTEPPLFRVPMLQDIDFRYYPYRETAKFETVDYRAVKFRDADGEELFVYTSGDTKTVLKDLIAGYRKPK